MSTLPLTASDGLGLPKPDVSSAVLLRTVVFLFVSTTPALGAAGPILTGLCFVTLLFGWEPPARGATPLILIFLALILPITLYDLFVSLDQGFITASFIGIPMFLVAGFVFSQSTGKAEFLDVYERAFFYLAVPSFVLFMLFVLRQNLIYLLPEYDFRQTINRTALLLNIQMNPDPVLRNAGFSSEPGFYQILVNTALYARLRRLGRPDKTSIFYLIVALSTVSTAGIVVSSFLVALKFDLKYRLFIVVLILLFLGAAQEFIINQYNSKIANDNVFGPRFIPSLNAFDTFKDNLFGIGAVEYTNTYERLDIGSWDSYTQIAMRYGLPGLIGFLIFLLSLGRRHIILLSVLALSFITSPIWFFPALSAFYFPSGRDDEDGR